MTKLSRLADKKLGDQFYGSVAGSVLILDGDGPAYVAAATAKTLETAERNFKRSVLTSMFMCKAAFCRIHLTHAKSYKAGRFTMKGAKPYQGNRKDKPKPPLLEPLREHIAKEHTWLPEYEVQMHTMLEADDGMMMDAYRYKHLGIIRSEDKDLRITPYPWFDIERGVVDATPNPASLELLRSDRDNSPKLVGRGPLFFWAQMLMGDTADNVAGLTRMNGKPCGAVTAYETLNWPGMSDVEAARLVIDAYAANEQNPLPEGYMLWLLRTYDDSFWKYVTSLDLGQQRLAWLNEWVREDWFIKEENECENSPDPKP